MRQFTSEHKIKLGHCYFRLGHDQRTSALVTKATMATLRNGGMVAKVLPRAKRRNCGDRATPTLPHIQVLKNGGGSAMLLAVARLVYARGDMARDGDDDRTGDDAR